MAGTRRVAIDKLPGAIQEILDEYADNIYKSTGEAAKAAADAALKAVRAGSPVKTGKYRRGWTSKKQENRIQSGAVVYNASRWQLTHLLEHGHAIRNGHGATGFVGGVSHIAPAEEAAVKIFEDAVIKAAEGRV